MLQQSQYCAHCGAVVIEGASFCNKCGGAVANLGAPDPTPSQDPIFRSEPVVAVIPNAVLKAGFMGVKSRSFTIALTERRVLFARLTSNMMKDLVQGARDEATEQGKGFFGKWGAQLSAYSTFAETYLKLSPDEILSQNPDNFAIDRATIQKVKVKAGTSYDDGNTTSDRLIIKTTGQKFDIDLGAGGGQAKKALLAARMI